MLSFARLLSAVSLMVSLLGFAQSSFAQQQGYGMSPDAGVSNLTPKSLQNVGVTEQLGNKIDLDLKFRNEAGELVPLRSYFSNNRPVILSLAYFNCPGLCSFHLNGLTQVFKKLNWTIGREFNVVVVSFDPKEKSPLAAAKKKSYLRLYDRGESNDGWSFLTGDEPQIQALAKQVGFEYHWDEASQQYAHASVAYILTPDGRLSRYLYGIDFDPRTVRLSLVEASNGVVGNVVDKLILFCFHYDAGQNKYALAAINVMRTGGALMVLILAAFLLSYWLRQRKLVRKVQGEV
jgi:protein SCO1/2